MLLAMQVEIAPVRLRHEHNLFRQSCYIARHTNENPLNFHEKHPLFNVRFLYSFISLGKRHLHRSDICSSSTERYTLSRTRVHYYREKQWK